ncbi:MAG: isoprenylcysteine carboxylmethyltransferase family protein [Devosia sp.]
MTYSYLFAALWAAWIVSWAVAAMWASKPASRPRDREELFHWGVLVAGSALLFLNFRTGRLDVVWTDPGWVEWVLLAVAAAGLAFTWWARIHLGTLWSGRVTRKADHRIVDTGPYGLVRHPIYTGILTAIYATVLLRPGVFGIAGAALLTLSFVIKLRLEERFLMQELGAEAYEGYRKRVPALVPFWPMRG